jgi:hypothetical protein
MRECQNAGYEGLMFHARVLEHAKEGGASKNCRVQSSHMCCVQARVPSVRRIQEHVMPLLHAFCESAHLLTILRCRPSVALPEGSRSDNGAWWQAPAVCHEHEDEPEQVILMRHLAWRSDDRTAVSLHLAQKILTPNSSNVRRTTNCRRRSLTHVLTTPLSSLERRTQVDFCTP